MTCVFAIFVKLHASYPLFVANAAKRESRALDVGWAGANAVIRASWLSGSRTRRSTLRSKKLPSSFSIAVSWGSDRAEVYDTKTMTQKLRARTHTPTSKIGSVRSKLINGYCESASIKSWGLWLFLCFLKTEKLNKQIGGRYWEWNNPSQQYARAYRNCCN